MVCSGRGLNENIVAMVSRLAGYSGNPQVCCRAVPIASNTLDCMQSTQTE
jgi:hypothetical protein